MAGALDKIAAASGVKEDYSIISWLVTTVLWQAGMLRADGLPRVGMYLGFLAVQVYFLLNLRGSVWGYEEAEMFFGFAICMLVLHASYITLIEQRSIKTQSGGLRFRAAYNACTDARQIEAAIPLGVNGGGCRMVGYMGVDGNGKIDGTFQEDGSSMTNGEHITEHRLGYFASIWANLGPRTRFVITRCVRCAVIYYTRKVITWGFNIGFSHLEPDTDFTPEHIPILRRLHRVTLREATIRAGAVVLAASTGHLSLEQWHAGLAAAHVALRVSRPEDWPPLFGSLSEVTSLTAYWSRYWHRVFARPSLAWARWLAGRAGIRRGTRGYRAFTVACVFGASAAMHVGVRAAAGEKCGLWEDFAQPLHHLHAVLLEMGFWAGLEGTVGRARLERRSGLVRGLGRVWVVGFLWWLGPRAELERVVCQLRG